MSRSGWACSRVGTSDSGASPETRSARIYSGWSRAALAGVFAQLAQAQGQVQGPTLAQHPVITWSYRAFDACLVVSVLAVALGGVPLWLVMLRRARRARRRREVALLLAAAVVPAVYLVVSLAVLHLVRGSGRTVVPWESRPVVDLANGGVGPRWFLALVLLGFAAALVSAAGPALALRRLRPHGPVLVLASAVAVVSATRGIRAADPPAVA